MRVSQYDMDRMERDIEEIILDNRTTVNLCKPATDSNIHPIFNEPVDIGNQQFDIQYDVPVDSMDFSYIKYEHNTPAGDKFTGVCIFHFPLSYEHDGVRVPVIIDEDWSIVMDPGTDKVTVWKPDGIKTGRNGEIIVHANKLVGEKINGL